MRKAMRCYLCGRENRISSVMSRSSAIRCGACGALLFDIIPCSACGTKNRVQVRFVEHQKIACGKCQAPLTNYHFEQMITKRSASKRVLCNALNIEGKMQQWKGEWESAIQLFQQAQKYSPATPERRAAFTVSIGLCHAYLGNYEQAAASLEAVDPVVIHDDFSVVYDLARAYGVMGELEEAIEWFEKARTLLAQTTSVQHLDDLLNILYEIQAVEPARSIAVPTQILLYDAMRDYETQNIQAGVQKLRRALEMNPLDPVICHQLGIGLLHQDKCEEAIDMLERGLEFDPLHEQAQLALGDAYFHLGMYECALNAYKQTLHLNPHNIDAYHHLGLVYERQGEIDIAKGYWEDVLKADPHHAEAIRSLKRYDN